MAPRKRKIEAPAADSGILHGDDGAPLRRSTRQKTAPKLPDSNQEEPAAVAPNHDDAEQETVARPAKNKEDQVTAGSVPTIAKVFPSSPPFAQFAISSAKRDGKPTACLRSRYDPEWPVLIFTHGAASDLSAVAMVNFSTGFTASKLEIGMVMFQGNMNLKARASLFDVVKQHELGNGRLKGGGTLAYGGRSMGARAAVIAAQTDQDVQALVLVSYPLVGPSGDVRDKILLDIRPEMDVLFISGANDNMCDWDKLAGVRGKMKAKTWCAKVQGADHGMNNRGGKTVKVGTLKLGNMTGKVAAEWLRGRDEEKREMDLSWNGVKVITSGWGASAK